MRLAMTAVMAGLRRLISTAVVKLWRRRPPKCRDPAGTLHLRGQVSTSMCCPSTAEKNMFHYCRDV